MHQMWQRAGMAVLRRWCSEDAYSLAGGCSAVIVEQAVVIHPAHLGAAIGLPIAVQHLCTAAAGSAAHAATCTRCGSSCGHPGGSLGGLSKRHVVPHCGRNGTGYIDYWVQ